MLCDICKKNEATIHIKEMHHGKWTSLNLCAECAKNNNLDTPPGDAPQLDIAQMLVGLGKALEEQQKQQSAPKPQSAPPEQKQHPGLALLARNDVPNCPVCNWSVEDIRENPGKFGCPACYKNFNEVAELVFKNTQKGNCHIGKTPEHAPDTRREAYEYTYSMLEKTLAKHIADENYEEAAKLRDAMNAMKAHFIKTEGEE